MVNFLKLSSEVACEIVYEDSDEYTVVEDIITGKSRWSIMHDVIFMDNITGKYYKGDYSVGATESQDESPWEYVKEVTFTEVEPYNVTVVKYKVKE
jgi:hypothetical protein